MKLKTQTLEDHVMNMRASVHSVSWKTLKLQKLWISAERPGRPRLLHRFYSSSLNAVHSSFASYIFLVRSRSPSLDTATFLRQQIYPLYGSISFSLYMDGKNCSLGAKKLPLESRKFIARRLFRASHKLFVIKSEGRKLNRFRQRLSLMNKRGRKAILQ